MLPSKLYRCEQVRALDRLVIEAHNTPGIVLMKRAGRAAFARLNKTWPEAKAVVVLCGGGNNGGDGYIIAGLAAQQQKIVKVLHLYDPTQLTGDAALAFQFAQQENVEILPFNDRQMVVDGSVIVDAMLGTGLSGGVRDDYKRAIKWVNNVGFPVLAVDVPSGICGDTGVVLGAAVNADITLTFIGLKQGLLTARAPAFVGDLFYDDLDVPDNIFEQIPADAIRIGKTAVSSNKLERPKDAHKGMFGHVLVVGGDIGYGGAGIMAAEAALAAGSGLVGLATQPEHVAPALACRPELMVAGVKSGQSLEPLLDKPSVLVVGPGLGRSSWSEQFLQKSLDTDLPLVLDADALNLLAGPLQSRKNRGKWILTPHPGEAARLLGTSTDGIQSDRFKAARELQSRYGGIIVLKGAGTIIADEAELYLADVGNPAMAVGGTGDILSGVVGALLAQGLSPLAAAKLAVSAHGEAADCVIAQGPNHLFASELIPALRKVLH